MGRRVLGENLGDMILVVIISKETHPARVMALVGRFDSTDGDGGNVCYQ
jgi:hypothetical protein